MGRPREFDEEAALTHAMEAFREKGYVAVSIKDLEDATGLKAGSIYNSYGDKAGLFRAAMEHYHRVVLAQRVADYATKAAGVDGLRRLFLSLLREPNGTSFGCLITNAAVEFGRDDGAPVDTSVGLRLLWETFRERLTAARRAGQLRADISPSRAATALLALYQGILVLHRAGWETAALDAMIRDEFNRLGARP